MVRVDVTDLSLQGTWIDGHLPGIEKMRQIAQEYRHLDVDQHGPGAYGFSQATDAWLQEDYFGAIAAAIRTKFDRERLHPDVRPVPCFMWLLRMDKEPSIVDIRPLYEEHTADPEKENYYHLIAIHDAFCPVAENCLQEVMRDLCFESKPETAYADKDNFIDSVRKALGRYTNLMAAPWLEVERQLDALSNSVVSAGP